MTCQIFIFLNTTGILWFDRSSIFTCYIFHWSFFFSAFEKLIWRKHWITMCSCVTFSSASSSPLASYYRVLLHSPAKLPSLPELSNYLLLHYWLQLATWIQHGLLLWSSVSIYHPLKFVMQCHNY